VLLAFPQNRQAGDRTDGFFAGYSGMGVRFTSADGSFVFGSVAVTWNTWPRVVTSSPSPAASSATIGVIVDPRVALNAASLGPVAYGSRRSFTPRGAPRRASRR